MSTAAIRPVPSPCAMWVSSPRQTYTDRPVFSCPAALDVGPLPGRPGSPRVMPRQGTDSAVERVVRLGGVRLQLREAGPADGPPLLLLNGIGAHVGMWRPLEDALRGTRLIAFDAPGAGRSQTPPTPLTFAGHARVAERLLDALEVE